MADVKLRKVNKSFGSVHVIHDVDLDINDQDFVVFVGPSGCGKSTLLRLIAGLEDITSGSLMIDGQEVSNLPPKHRGIAMVFQSYALYPHMTVYENMAFGMKLADMDRDAINDRVQKAAEILQLERLLDRKPRELSGGQRQRVAIGRAITRNPKVFLFDEPLSNLDAALRVATRIEIAKLKQDLQATMVYVTHDQVEAMTLANKIVVLRAGIVEQVGSPLELYHHPRNLFVAGFIGSPRMNFVDTQIEEIDSTGVTVTIPGGDKVKVPVQAEQNGARRGDKVTLGIRPQQMNERAEGDAAIPGTVDVVERLGAETYLYLNTPNNQVVTIMTEGGSTTPVGIEVKGGFRAANCHIFREDGTAYPHFETHPLVEKLEAAE